MKQPLASASSMSSFTSRGNCRPLHDPQITSLWSNTHNLNLDHPLHFPRTNKHRDHSTQRDQSSTKPSRQPAILQPRTNVARRTRQTWLLHHQPEPRDFANTLPQPVDTGRTGSGRCVSCTTNQKPEMETTPYRPLATTGHAGTGEYVS